MPHYDNTFNERDRRGAQSFHLKEKTWKVESKLLVKIII